MSDLLCTACGFREPSKVEPVCGYCGSPSRPVVHCPGCLRFVPGPDVCPLCQVVIASAPPNASWLEAQAAADALDAALRDRVMPSMREQGFEMARLLRRNPSMTPAAARDAIRSATAMWAAQKAGRPPFSLRVCKAMHEASPRNLTQLRWRIEGGRPVRGLAVEERAAIAEHAKALAFSGREDDRLFGLGQAYLNVLGFSHRCVNGQVFRRDDRRPFELLAGISIPSATPLAAFGDDGVLAAEGPLPNLDPLTPWRPSRLVFATPGGARVDLSRVEPLQNLLADLRLPVSVFHLPGLLHLLLAPFDWESGVELGDPRLLSHWETHEGRGENVEIPELRLTVRPAGKRLVYRSGVLEVR